MKTKQPLFTIPKAKILAEIDRLAEKQKNAYTWGNTTPEELKKAVTGTKENSPGGIDPAKLAQLVDKQRCHKLALGCDRALSILISRGKDLRETIQPTL